MAQNYKDIKEKYLKDCTIINSWTLAPLQKLSKRILLHSTALLLIWDTEIWLELNANFVYSVLYSSASAAKTTRC